MLRKQTLLTALLLAVAAMPAAATIHTVFALNMAFQPSNLTVFSGDTIRWVWTTGAHTTTSVTIPAGALPWDAPLTSAAANDTFFYRACVVGTYSYKCTPHAPAMVGNFTVLAMQAPLISPTSAQLCPGDSVVLSTPKIANLSYQWMMGLTNISTDTNAIKVGTPSTYTVTITNTCGNSVQSLASQVQAAPVPVISLFHSSKFLCSGKCDSVGISTQVTGTTYTYSIQGITGTQPVAGNYFFFCKSGVHNTTTGPIGMTINATTPAGCTSSKNDTVTGLQTPVPSFTISNIKNDYTFTNTSTEVVVGATWVWNFGDGSPNDFSSSPQHFYTSYGNKTVSLKATNPNGCTATTTQVVTPVGINPLSALGDIRLYPNPANATLLLSGFRSGTAGLRDGLGRFVLQIPASLSGEIKIDVSGLPNGLYYLEVRNEHGRAAAQVSIQH